MSGTGPRRKNRGGGGNNNQGPAQAAQDPATLNHLQNKVALLEATFAISNSFVNELLDKDLVEHGLTTKLRQHLQNLRTAVEAEENKGVSEEMRNLLNEFGPSLHRVPESLNSKFLKHKVEILEVRGELKDATNNYDLKMGKAMSKFVEDFPKQERMVQYLDSLTGIREFDQAPVKELKDLIARGAEFFDQVMNRTKAIFQQLPRDSEADDKVDNFTDKPVGILERLDRILVKSKYCAELVQMMHQTSSQSFEPLAEGDGFHQRMVEQIHANLEAPEDVDKLEFKQFMQAWEEAMVLNFKPLEKHAPLEMYITVKRSVECFNKMIAEQIRQLDFEQAKEAALDVVEHHLQEEQTKRAENKKAREAAQKAAKEQAAAAASKAEDANKPVDGSEPHSGKQPEGPERPPQPQTEPANADDLEESADEECDDLPEEDSIPQDFKRAFYSLKKQESRRKVLDSHEYKTAHRLANEVQELETKLRIFRMNAESSIKILLKDCHKFFGEEAERWPDAKHLGYTPTMLMDNIYVRRLTDLEETKERNLDELEDLQSKLQEQTAVAQANQELLNISSLKQKDLEEEKRRLQGIASNLEKQAEALKVSEGLSKKEAKELLEKYTAEVQKFHQLSQELKEQIKANQEQHADLVKRKAEIEADYYVRLDEIQAERDRQEEKRKLLNARNLELDTKEQKLRSAGTGERFAKQRSSSRSPSPIPPIQKSELDKTVEYDFAKNKDELERMRGELQAERERMNRKSAELDTFRSEKRELDEKLNSQRQKLAASDSRCNALSDEIANLKGLQATKLAPNVSITVILVVAILSFGSAWLLAPRTR